MSFVTTWVDQEGFTLSEISQRQIPYDLTYMWNLKNKMKQKETHRYRDQMGGCQTGGGWGFGRNR